MSVGSTLTNVGNAFHHAATTLVFIDSKVLT